MMVWDGLTAWLAMVLMMAAMLVVILLGVWIIARPFSRWAESKRSTDPALEELRRRYAQGDIEAEEYEERRRRLARAD